MGPNLYVTPPESITHFHLDGHGTVDSGHLCIDGYNEVVMLRRMPECHSISALQCLDKADRRITHDTSNDNVLYSKPHDDQVSVMLLLGL